jgi:hypothetical protein
MIPPRSPPTEIRAASCSAMDHIPSALLIHAQAPKYQYADCCQAFMPADAGAGASWFHIEKISF